MASSMLFTPLALGSLTIPNRLVRSATWEGLAAADGASTPALNRAMAELAHGGVGLIISSHAYVSPEGKVVRGQLGADNDGLLPGLREMTQAVHAAGGRIALQLAHGGGFAGGEKITGRPALGPSSFAANQGSTAQEMPLAEIARVTADFARATSRAKDAGFDAVQIHSAHGYLLSEFLSPHYNHRTDAYGGSLANRARFLLDVLAAIRATVGNAYPVLVKINSEDFADDGLTVTEMVEVARLLEQGGIDGIELSGGLPRDSRFAPIRSGLQAPEQEVYYRDAGLRCKAGVHVPVILVGGIRTRNVAEALITDGATDAIALSRSLIREPGLPNRWATGDRAPSGCTSCNLCRRPALFGNGLICVADPRYKEAVNRPAAQA